jgi:hypothetical protein
MAHTKENCPPSWLYVQDYKGPHGQQNVKKNTSFSAQAETQRSARPLEDIKLHHTRTA